MCKTKAIQSDILYAKYVLGRHYCGLCVCVCVQRISLEFENERKSGAPTIMREENNQPE